LTLLVALTTALRNTVLHCDQCVANLTVVTTVISIVNRASVALWSP